MPQLKHLCIERTEWQRQVRCQLGRCRSAEHLILHGTLLLCQLAVFAATRLFLGSPHPTPSHHRHTCTQGVRGLFKGWGAQWARQGPMTTVIFVVNEFLRSEMGMPTL